MPEATLNSKGQITIPKAIRDRLGLKTGDRVVFTRRPGGEILIEAETVDVAAFEGC